MQQQDPEKVDFPAYGLLLLEAAARMAPIDSGEVTSPAGIGSNVLNAGDKNWPVGKLAYNLVVIYAGAGQGQARVIQWNAVNTLVIEGGWDVALDTTSKFKIVSLFDLRQALRDVLGGGKDISAANPLRVYDPKVGSLISFSGTTTADGAGDGSTLRDSVLTTKPNYDGNQVIITSGAYAGQARDINGVTTGDTVTPASAFGGQIVEGTTFTIVGIRTVPAEVAALTALVVALGADVTAIIATLATIAGYIDTEIAAILAAVDTEVDAIEAKLDVQKGATGVFYEQADAAVNITAPNDAETNFLHLSAGSTRYIVRSLRLKCADPDPNTVTVRLYELVNDGLVEVDSFEITTANFADYHSLTDMFGLFALAGDELKVTVRASAGGPYVVTGQYSSGKTNV